MTGGRVKRIKPHLNNETFLLTYGDGVSNINLDHLISFHKSHGKLVTITAVRPPARFGELEIEDNDVISFKEKPQLQDGWINGGFFVLSPKVLELIKSDDDIWEREPLESLAKSNNLMAYKHEGFWQPMDTLRDKNYLENLWASGAPWKTW